MSLQLLISPLAQQAFFGEVEAVALAELEAHHPGCDPRVHSKGPLRLVEVSLSSSAAESLARLSWVQAVFETVGQDLRVLEIPSPFIHPPELVTGNKYRGKTNELATQMAINLAIAACRLEPKSLLDPVAGRGTTLLWALRYGLEAWGIEKDPAAIDHLRRHLGRQTKLRRLKHKLQTGGKAGKAGAFLDLQLLDPSGRMRLVTGSSQNAGKLLQNKRVELIVGDLPYGVQHVGPGGTRDPSKVLEACARPWTERLKDGGAMVLLYNRLLPKREVLAPLFEKQGLRVLDWQAPHRMSESILRDVPVMVKD